MRNLFFAAALGAAAFAAVPGQDPVARGVSWLERTQGADGGWGQDGGATSHVRQGERLESNANDAANTAVALLALHHAGKPAAALKRGVEFLLREVEESPEQGLAITKRQGTQIQRKLGPYIDTFLTSMALSEFDGRMGDAALNARVRKSLEKCVRKIQTAQLGDGSWNHSGGWAPILGTSLASRSLAQARDKGVRVKAEALEKVDEYSRQNAGRIVANAAAPGRPVAAASGAGAGVALYDRAQTLEQLSRTESDRKRNAKAIAAITAEMDRPEVVNGFGSMGGEEFFSYLNISDSLRRSGGEPWRKWNAQIRAQLTELQNADGTWAGHHCITGRVAVTSAALLTLTADRRER